LRRWWWRQLAANRAGVLIVVALLLVTLLVPMPALPFRTLLVLAAVLAAGTLRFFLTDARVGRPPGKRFPIGRIRLHLLAEGEAGAHRPVIWVGGGHGEGLVMAHLHRAIARETRSILFDRAGAGWSDPAPLPLTIASEVAHLDALLSAAGEQGPFVLAGHSFGGLFALNFAQRFPERVAALVVMDPTPPANVTVAGRVSFGALIAKAPWRALALQFGMRWAGDPEIDDSASAFGRAVSEWADVINRNSLQPKSVIAEAAAFEAAMHRSFDMVTGDGALADIPLVLMLADPHAADEQHVHDQVKELLRLDVHQQRNFWRAMDESNEAQLRLSGNSHKVMAAPGSSHMFPYECPEVVLDQVRRMLRVSAPAGEVATDSRAR